MVPVDRDLDKLAPRFRARVEQLVERLQEAGQEPWVFETFRTRERQEWLYAQGRTRPGAIVTRARDHTRSWHGFGLAVDIIDRKRLWDAMPVFWRLLGEHSRALGLVWGGDWESFPDRPHVQWGAMPVSPPRADRELVTGQGPEAIWRRYGAI